MAKVAGVCDALSSLLLLAAETECEAEGSPPMWVARERSHDTNGVAQARSLTSIRNPLSNLLLRPLRSEARQGFVLEYDYMYMYMYHMYIMYV